MKDFAVYTAMRFGVFAATIIVVAAIWALVTEDGVPWFPVLLVSAFVSMIISIPLLNKPRIAFATRVEARATAALDAARAREDSERMESDLKATEGEKNA